MSNTKRYSLKTSAALVALLTSMTVVPALAAPARDTLGFAFADGAAAQTPSRSSPIGNIAPKPVAPIAISHEFGGLPMVGLPLDLTLSFAAAGDLTELSVTLTADDPLAMIEPVGTVDLGPLAAGTTSDLAVTVLPLVDQTHYLGVSVTAVINGVPQTRSLSLPIRMSEVVERKAGDAPAIQKSGEQVRSFEAIETIR